jgi:hypothetical protein
LKSTILSKMAFAAAVVGSLFLAAEGYPVSAKETGFLAEPAKNDAINAGQIRAEVRSDRNHGYVILVGSNDEPSIATTTRRYQSELRKRSGSLITMNGIHVNHLSLNTVKQMLRGPIGTSVCLQILTDQGERRTFKVLREGPEPVPNFSQKTEAAWMQLRTLTSFTGPDQFRMMETAHTERYENQNLELVVRNLKRVAVRAAMQLSDEQNLEAYQALTSAAVACDRLGDIDTASEYLKLAISKAGPGVIYNRQHIAQKKPLDHLLALGRYNECKKLCELGLAAERSVPKPPYGDMQLRREIRLADIYADALTQLKDKNASKAVSEYFDYLKQTRSAFDVEGIVRIGELFNELGEYNQAIAAQKKAASLVDQHLVDQHLKEKPQLKLSEISWPNQINYRLAQYQSSAGQYADAINTLSALEKIWRERVDADSFKNAGELAITFPAPGDIYLARARLNLLSKRPIEAIKDASRSVELMSLALGANDYSLKAPLLIWAKALREEGDFAQANRIEKQANKLHEIPQLKDYSEVDKSRMIRNASSLIHDGNEAEAKKVVAKLCDIYRREGKPPLYYRPEINMFCSLLNIARQFSDKQYYEDSDQLLTRLLASVETQEKTPEVVPFLIIEKSINAERRHKDILQEWTDIADNLEDPTEQPAANDAGKSIRALHRQKNLRTIADLYLGAGADSRANLILSKSTHFQIERQKSGELPGVEAAEEDSLLKIDYALLSAEQGSPEKAEQLAKEAISKCPSQFLTMAAPKGYEFKNSDETNQKFVRKFEIKIQTLVESLFLKNELLTAKNILTELFQKSKLAFDTHKTSETLKLCDEKKDWDNRVSDGTFEALMANILYRLGKPAEALEFVNSNVANERIPTPSFYILAGDIANTNNLPGLAAHFYSEAEKSGPQVVFAMDQDNFASRKKLLQKAATLASSDAAFDKIEKANIFMRYAIALESEDKLKSLQYLQQAYELVPDTEPRKAELLDRITRLSPQVTLKELTPAKQRAQDKELIENLHKAAHLAESNGREDAFEYWLSLADKESQTGNLTDAIEHAEHAILLLHKNREPIQYRAPFYCWSKLTESLALHNELQNAEKIYIDAFEKLKSLDGKDSFSSARQGIQLVLFYLEHQQDKDAIRFLGQLVKDCPRALEIGWPESAISELEQIQPKLFKQNRGEVILQIEQMILDNTLQTYAEDDERIANSLVDLAALEKALNKEELAEAHLNESSRIFKFYFFEPETHARKAFEAKLADLGVSGYKKINRFFERNVELSNYFPVELNSESENIDELQKHYDHIRISTPYGVAAEGDLDNLIEIGSKTQNWEVLAKAATARLNIFEHRPDPLAGRQTGCLISDLNRFRYYELAIEANLQLGRKDEASELIVRAEANATAPSFHEMCKLSKLALDCGNTAESERLAMRAEDLMENETWEFQDLVKLWRKLGRENEAAAVEAKAKRIKDEYDARMQALDKGAFNHFNI